MNDLTFVIIGGGYAGLLALKQIQSATRGSRQPIRFVLIDKQPGHLRKMRLFRPAAVEEDIIVPWDQLTLKGFEFVQGTVTSVDSREQFLRYTDALGNDAHIHYDRLIVTVGSVVRPPDPNQGGVPLIEPQDAANIRERWRANMRKAVDERNPEERKRLMTIAVAGAGISGIETSAELAIALKKEAAAMGLKPADVSVYLLNAREQLLPEVSEKFRRRLDQQLTQCGVTVLHNHKALREEAGEVTFSSGHCMKAGLLIWTLGLMPSPSLQNMGLPLTLDGKVMVDESYRVHGMKNVYSIGDCAGIVDPKDGRATQMTCFEAGEQGLRLGKVVLADLEGRPAPIHHSAKSNMDAYTVALGQQGVFWIRKWGLDMVMTGKLPGRLKKLVEDATSMLR